MNAPLPSGFARADAEASDETGMELLLWILVWSELVVFAVLLTAFLILNLLDPAGFSEARRHLDIPLAGFATVALLVSGFFAARATRGLRARRDLVIAALGGFVFCALKFAAYLSEGTQPAAAQQSRMFELYVLITGFHLVHVAVVALLLLVVAWRPSPRAVATATTLWHLVDLVWILILPVVYLG